jgi:hypothetical protein
MAELKDVDRRRDFEVSKAKHCSTLLFASRKPAVHVPESIKIE